jgi:Na+/H+ antiporter NhaD/arsenite permease-like protein
LVPTLLQQFDPSIFLSLAFLFGIAAQFLAMDGQTFLRRLVGILESRVGVVYAIFLVAGIFSPFVLNDVVIIILTPVVVKYARQFAVDPAPLLVAEITMTNVASSLTPFGNPQNILLWASSRASFSQFVAGTSLPVLISVLIAALALLPQSRRAGGAREIPPSIGSVSPAVYLMLVAATIFLSDFAGLPTYLSLGAAFVLGFIFTSHSLEEVGRGFDVRSLLTLCFFVGSVTLVSMVLKPVLIPYVQPAAMGRQPYSALFFGVVSNFISNVPATQMVLSIAKVTPVVASRTAISAGFAGNISPAASFANILALQIARRAGVPVRRAIALQLVVGVLSFLPAFL